uniref:pyocin knob domain-containing protein n=1 Tax=Candidatus Fimivicinus sp. TaxID=3056640 RepID=UPI0040283133
MATWDNVVYTTLGLNLMAKLQTGATLEITRAVGGDGHTSADALTALTEVTARQTLTLSNVVYKGSGQALLPVTLYNRGLTAGYPLRQIGIYAADPDDGEVLMLVAQSEQPDTIPSAEDSPDFVANFSFHIALGNAGRINVSYSLTDMATKADYVAYVEQIEGRLGQPSGIATLDSSGKLAQMPTAADVGAVPSMLTDIIYVDQADPVPHYDNLNNYITPGQRVHIATVTTARSVDNCPEVSPGIMEVAEYNHSVKTGQTLGIIQRYIATSGNTYTRIYTHQNGYWSNWASGALKPMQPYVSTQLTGSGYVYFACYGLDAGSYIFTACGNFNKGGSDLYRATYTAIIHISCDYDSAAKQVIARVSHAPLLISAAFGDSSDSKFDVGFNSMAKTMPWSTWQSGGEPGKIYISAASSTSSSV